MESGRNPASTFSTARMAGPYSTLRSIAPVIFTAPHNMEDSARESFRTQELVDSPLRVLFVPATVNL